MQKILKRKKGSTLAELAVVIALVAIASLIIVSFSSMAYAYADRNEEEYLFLEECATAEEALRRCVAEIDDGTLICYTNVVENATTYSNIWFGAATDRAPAHLHYERYDDPSLSTVLSFETIQDISFERYTEALTGGATLIRCTIKGEGAREQSFLLVLRCANTGVNADA